LVITRHREPAGVRDGFRSEDDWFDYRLDTTPRFLKRVEPARRNVSAGQAIRLEYTPRKLPPAPQTPCVNIPRPSPE